MAEIENKKIRDILLPWARVVSVNSSATLDEVFQTVVSSGHTRLPVKHDNRVIGILHTKEFIALKESGETNWLSTLKPPLAVKPLDSAFSVMRLLQDKKCHMAIVVSVSGERVGIVTLEDILEEIVGEMYDEDDDSRIRKIYTAKVKSRSL